MEPDLGEDDMQREDGTRKGADLVKTSADSKLQPGEGGYTGSWERQEANQESEKRNMRSSGVRRPIALSSSPSAEAARFSFFFWSSRIRASIEFDMINLVTMIGLCWPIRCVRSIACSCERNGSVNALLPLNSYIRPAYLDGRIPPPERSKTST